MKFAMCLCLVLGLLGGHSLFAQTTYLLFRPRIMEPVADPFHEPTASLGMNVGYGNVFGDGHWITEHTIFADMLNSWFDFAPNKYFFGTTLYAGLALTPGYCINPASDGIRVTVSVSLKAGYNWGVETVYQTGPDSASQKLLEYKTAKGGITLAFAPTFSFEFGDGIWGLELGYDSSSYGAGINSIKSAYYHPIKYNTGYLFVGIFRRWH